MQLGVQRECNSVCRSMRFRSQALIEVMKAKYPDLLDASSLELSAKVLKGEMQWP